MKFEIDFEASTYLVFRPLDGLKIPHERAIKPYKEIKGKVKQTTKKEKRGKRLKGNVELFPSWRGAAASAAFIHLFLYRHPVSTRRQTV